MKFTPSYDGIPRANVTIKIRLTADQVKKIRKIAKRQETSLSEWLSRTATLEIENEIHNFSWKDD